MCCIVQYGLYMRILKWLIALIAVIAAPNVSSSQRTELCHTTMFGKRVWSLTATRLLWPSVTDAPPHVMREMPRLSKHPRTVCGQSFSAHVIWLDRINKYVIQSDVAFSGNCSLKYTINVLFKSVASSSMALIFGAQSTILSRIFIFGLNEMCCYMWGKCHVRMENPPHVHTIPFLAVYFMLKAISWLLAFL